MPLIIVVFKLLFLVPPQEKKYQKDFEEILRGVDKAYITPIYASAHEANGDISSEDLVKNISGSEVIDLDNIADLTKNKNSVIVFLEYRRYS